ncbi:glycosyltransferase family 2 protein [Methylobacterium nigriterrae]|uniref:glycosyltransferase family 2 protein n=1 Tax=Methylobacterium nigriterrae TaxID=3127512 RepID=UPI0030137759
MAILLFTTTDIRSPRRPEFVRLLSSILASENAAADLRHYVLLQNCLPDELGAYRAKAPACCRMVAVPGRLSLAEARNQLMALALEERSLQRDDIVGFPDDDCWFPPRFLDRLAGIFADRQALDLLICRVSLEPDLASSSTDSVMPASAPQVVRLSSSNNMFLRGSLVASIGSFDTGLGLGTSAGGGEDTDYAIRAFLNGSETGIIDRALVGHPAPDRDSAAKYFRGALIVLARYARSRPDLTREFLRKLLVGGYFFARGKLSARIYGQALREAVPGLRRAVTPRAA